MKIADNEKLIDDNKAATDVGICNATKSLEESIKTQLTIDISNAKNICWLNLNQI